MEFSVFNMAYLHMVLQMGQSHLHIHHLLQENVCNNVMYILIVHLDMLKSRGNQLYEYLSIAKV